MLSRYCGEICANELLADWHMAIDADSALENA